MKVLVTGGTGFTGKALVKRLIDEGLALSGGNADSPWVATFVTQRAILAALRGDGPTARALGDTVLSGALQRGYGAMAHAAHFALLQDALARDDDAAAFEHAAALSPPGTIARSVPLSLWVFFDLVAAAVRLGRIDEARRHVTAMEVRCR